MVVRMTIIFEVDLGVASIRDEGGGNMSDAIIPALKHRIPSELEVKRAWVRIVLGWVTSWEVLVLHSLFNYFLHLVTNISHVRDIY